MRREKTTTNNDTLIIRPNPTDAQTSSRPSNLMNDSMSPTSLSSSQSISSIESSSSLSSSLLSTSPRRQRDTTPNSSSSLPLRIVLPKDNNMGDFPFLINPLKHSTPTTTEYCSSTSSSSTDSFIIPNEKTRLLPSSSSSTSSSSTPLPPPSSSPHKQSTNSNDDNIHAQSLLLALAFFAIWTPQNLMAPNLTQMATYFNFSPSQRDTYLGANISFATAVLSLPLSGIIGFLADVVPSRRDLFAGVVVAGGLSSIATGLSRTYARLYAARFVNGGFMAGSVPIAFSLLGDLFETKDRNMASSGLTAMMGAGIVFGQVFAGIVGDLYRWELPFYVSGVLCVASAVLVMMFVEEPVRGGKEEVIQDILKKGGTYDRKLTWRGVVNAMRDNETNMLLMIQGFFGSVPWGIIFVFLNDYLSQEQGMTVPDATILVMIFGFGSAVGGIAGGALGQWTTSIRRSYMPIMMAISTLLGIIPFSALLNLQLHEANLLSMFISFMGGCIANLPSVNVRPIIINVNPPEVRGALLTTANLIINLARGIGPVFLTMTCGMFNVDRKFSFNILLIIFWFITSIQLLFLARTLPHDQDRMETELARYAKSITSATPLALLSPCSSCADNNDDDHYSIDDPISSFDIETARETCMFIKGGLKEIPLFHDRNQLLELEYSNSDEDDGTLEEYNNGRKRKNTIDADTCL